MLRKMNQDMVIFDAHLKKMTNEGLFGSHIHKK